MKAGEASATPIAAARARAAHLTRYAGPNVHENTFALRHPEIVRNRSNGSVPMMRCQPTNSLSSSTPVPVPWHAGNHGSRTSNLRNWLGAC